MLEKIAVNMMAGVASVKPSDFTSYLTELMGKEIVNSKILPEGSLQLIPGLGRGLLDHLNHCDVVSFTGSAKTGITLKSHPNILANAIPFNMEADSLNACVLGEDVKHDSDEFELFIKEIYKEMTIKAGQKCNAIRRILVPENLIEKVQAHYFKLDKILLATQNKEVRMGALASKVQVEREKRTLKY